MVEKGKASTESNNNTMYVAAAIILVVLVAIGIYYFTKPAQQPIVINNTTATVIEEGFKTYTVDITATDYSPASITIDNGDTIVWTNSDDRKHTITSDRLGELHSLVLLPGQSYTHQFTTTGTFYYHCEVHPEYKGNVKVE